MKFTFVGCSFTVGEGLLLEKDDPNNYTNLIANKYSAEISNLALSGNSNYNIFITALNELLFNTPDKIFVQWSAVSRLWLYPTPTSRLLILPTINDDYTNGHISYSKKQLQEFANIYHILNHDYHNLIELTNYCNILSKVSHNQIIFINGILPWTKEILNKTASENFSKNLSDYLKEILEFDNSDDVKLIESFNKLNAAVESLNQTQWVNLFESMEHNKIDVGNDNSHPGPRSHQKYAEMIINYLEDIT